MTRATANFNFWIINNASRLRARLSTSPSFDEDAFQDAYRKHTGKHLSETYDTSHPDDLFFTLLPSADEDDEEEATDEDKPGLAASIRRYIRKSFSKQETTAFEMRMKGFSYRDIADVTGLGATAFNNVSDRIIAATRLQFAGINL